MERLAELGSDVQALSHRLNSGKLEQLGLTATAAGFCREIAAKYGLDVVFRADVLPESLTADAALCLFRVLQEALQNATKHSDAAQVWVSLSTGIDDVTLTVCDAGKGFDPRDAMAAAGIGLTNMHERLRLVGGTLSIDSAPGRGTLLCARVPHGQGPPKTEGA